MIPKFRAWDPHEKKMIDDKELVIWGGNIYRGERDKIFKKSLRAKKDLSAIVLTISILWN